MSYFFQKPHLFQKMPRGRIAVSILFFINGLLVGAWTPMIPLFKQRIDLTESEIGLVILALGLGSLSSMPFTGAYIAKNGTRIPCLYLTIISSFGLTFLALVPDFWVAFFVMFIFGASWAGMDVSMNSNVIEIEQIYKFPIMSSCHGFWSIGGLLGALGGGLTLTIFGEFGHGIFWQILFLLLALYALLNLETDTVIHDKKTRLKLEFPRSAFPYILGIVALFSVVPEGIIIDWSALFLSHELGASTAMAGTGFAASSMAMAIMRFFGDHLREKYGSVLILRISVITAIIGFAIITLSSSPVLFLPPIFSLPLAIAVPGFFIAGLGLANLFPIALSAAGNLPNIPNSIAVSIVTTFGYGGLLLAPPLFGFIAQEWGYTIIYAMMPVCLISILFILYPVRYADISSHDT